MEVVAIIRGFFIADPFGLSFRALLVFCGIVELAITAAVQVGIAPGAGIHTKHAAT